MESIRNAATAAANAIGLETSQTSTHTNTNAGVAPQNSNSYSQSGVEPVSGKLGQGNSGMPYDAGNEQDGLGSTSGTAGRTSGYGTGATSGSGYGTGATSGSGYTSGATTGSGQGYGSGIGATSGTTNTPSYGERIGSALGLTSSGQHSTAGTASGLTGSREGVTGTRTDHSSTTAAAGASASGLYESSEASRRGTGPHVVGSGSGSGLGSNTLGTSSSGLHTPSSHSSKSSATGVLGSEIAAGQGGDRYLFHKGNAPGAGGRMHKHKDDFTDSNIYHQGSGDIVGLGSDVSAGYGTGTGTSTPSSTTETSSTGLGKSSRPTTGRQASGLGSSDYGLNSGRTNASRDFGAAGAGAGAATGAGVAHELRHKDKQPSLSQRVEDKMTGNTSTTTSREAGMEGVPHGAGSDERQAGYQGVQPRDTSSRSDAEYAGAAGAYSTSDNRTTTRDADYAEMRGATKGAHGIEGSHVSGAQYGGGAAAGGREGFLPHPTTHEGDASTHPTGVAAHTDPKGGNTFLNYQHDQFNLPTARGN